MHIHFQLAQQCIQISTRINSSSVHTYIFVCFTLRVILQGFVTQNATVCSEVIGQISFMCKCFVALITLKWFLSAVYSEMPSQSRFPCKCFVTLVTFKRSFSAVGSDMPNQIYAFFKPFPH